MSQKPINGLVILWAIFKLKLGYANTLKIVTTSAFKE